MDYIKAMKKLKTMNSKSWTHRLTKVCNLMYYMITSKNYVLSQENINIDVIDKNIPLKRIINWRKTTVYNKTKKYWHRSTKNERHVGST